MMMKSKIILLAFGILELGLVVPGAQGALTLNTLVSFNVTNGANPYAGLLLGKDGNFYGTTAAGGTNSYGTVFQMTPAGAHTLLAMFRGTNGANPTAGLVESADGKFYGTTYAGGASGYGTVFRVESDGTLTLLVSFAGTNGVYPKAALVEAPDGSYYGTTAIGGTNNVGTVFNVTTNGALTTLVTFDPQGASPYTGLMQGTDGSFYGTTYLGTNGYGTIFKLTTNGAFTTLHTFTGGSDGANPYAELVQGADGIFYGTTFFGGSNGFGTAFKMTTNGTLTTLVSFAGTNGAYPQGRLVQSSDGILYGMTENGGVYPDQSSSDYGTLFKLTTNGALTTLVSFAATNGAYPQGGLAWGPDGNLYGTTASGGANGKGTIFRLSFPPPPMFQTVTGTATAITMTWSATVGEAYQMLYKTNLAQGDWMNWGSTIIATNTLMSTLDVTGPDSQRFYRIKLLP
jgi:uncharacterized repeat protein (TIGR03803 family)